MKKISTSVILWSALICGGRIFAADAQVEISPNECFPNGTFEQMTVSGQVAAWPSRPEVVPYEGGHALKLDRKFSLEWEMPGKPVWGAEYVLRFRVKAVNAGGGDPQKGARLVLWTRLPEQHEPPREGILLSRWWRGTFDWQVEEIRFRMLPGVSRFLIFFEGDHVKPGECYIDDISIHPVDDRPLSVSDAKTYGSAERETLAWIWSRPGFDFNNLDMGKDAARPVEASEVQFRRIIECPADMSAAQAVFCGDDWAALTVNGKEVGKNEMVQDVARVPLDGVLRAGKNTVVWTVRNEFGPAGLIGRVEWKDSKNHHTLLPTNENWECSEDGGATWRPASLSALPVPAPTNYYWLYPHLEKVDYQLSYNLPPNVSGARLAVRATGSVEVAADGKNIFGSVSSGREIKADLGDALNGAKTLTLTLSDISQPPAGAGAVELTVSGTHRRVELGDFRVNGKAPLTVSALYPDKTWPLNVAAFEAAATRPPANLQGRLEPWAAALLADAQEIFRLGEDDNSSAEFGDMSVGDGAVTAPLTVTKDCPRGLEGKLRPELNISFNLKTVPVHGAALTLDVEDADSMVVSVGVFVNGIFAGMPQIIGYDLVPGQRLTNRAWVVTLPKELLQTGDNRLTLRLLPSYYNNQTGVENQAQEYIKLLRLGDRKGHPYPTTAWLHWDYIQLSALAKPLTDTVNGRPVWLGINSAYGVFNGLDQWDGYFLRDLSWLGLDYTDAPYRVPFWSKNQLRRRDDYPSLSADETNLDYQLASLVRRGIRPFILFDPGRGVTDLSQFEDSYQVAAIKQYGKFTDMVEIGNEVDHPRYGWDAFNMAAAYVDIQRQAVCGQLLKKHADGQNLKLTGEGWYHAWDFSVIDAQARKEADSDPAWTDELSAHNYGKSYIIPAVTYYLLYGVNPPKPIWVTECGSWTANDTDIGDFDLNLRGNLAYATYIVQYLSHPYDREMRHFSLFSAQSKDAEVLEKARCYRRLLHAFSLHGKPLPWRYDNPEKMRDKLVLVRAVDAGKAYKISFVNFSKEQQRLSADVTLSVAGKYKAVRHGDGLTVSEGTREVTLAARPAVSFQETLNAGETVEYLIVKP